MLTDVQIKELERRGLSNVKTMLKSMGYGRGASIPLSETSEIHVPNLGGALRGDIEDWILSKELEDKAAEERKFKIELRWIIATFIVSLIGTLAAVIALL